MVFPLRDPGPPDLDADHPQASAGLAAPDGDRDLARLAASIQWVEREAQIVRREAGLAARNKPVALPRAAQLPPVARIAPVNAEGPRERRRETTTFLLAPPLADERLSHPRPPRRRRGHLRGVLFILVASMIAGSITYRVSIGELFPASVPAQAAHLQAQ